MFVSFSAFSAVYDPVAIVAVTAPLVLPEMVFASATDTVPDTDTVSSPSRTIVVAASAAYAAMTSVAVPLKPVTLPAWTATVVAASILVSSEAVALVSVTAVSYTHLTLPTSDLV